MREQGDPLPSDPSLYSAGNDLFGGQTLWDGTVFSFGYFSSFSRNRSYKGRREMMKKTQETVMKTGPKPL